MKWCSVDDKLPEINEKVLFYSIQDKYLERIYMGYLNHEGWNIYSPYTSICLKELFTKVTHWMELPEYPNKEICEHNNIDFTPVYQCDDCKNYVLMD